ncbi:MAG TPA: YceI family protein [Candidatus Pseudogracilibacillus intestinigallinarum]|uniref:YceI family protein n=1 Tax=Candidatus Pseudogracilibacillus intestinigallinarum TaxID=2838742 RepID=A0A9D1PK18_9BACI|nr:YceI family protein [Candidatus Pseudogracilibacillus intestinigallinarum]
MVKWNIDGSHTSVGFEVKHMMVSKVRGRFGEFTGTIDGDPADLANCTITFDIDVRSIDTSNEDRDNHLRSPDFFEVDKYPKINFASKKIVQTAEDEFDIIGDITMKGVTKEITFAAEFEGKAVDPWGQEVAGFAVRGALNRKDFGLTWNQALEAGGVLVGDKIKISIDVEANPAKEA